MYTHMFFNSETAIPSGNSDLSSLNVACTERLICINGVEHFSKETISTFGLLTSDGSISDFPSSSIVAESQILL